MGGDKRKKKRKKERRQKHTRVPSRDLPLLHDLVKESRARALQPDARLRDDIGGEGEVCVDAEGGLVKNVVRVRVAVAVVHLGFRSDGDELVRGAQ